MSPRERELEDKLRKSRGEILELRMRIHDLERENAEQRRRLRVQGSAMEAAKQSAYEAYMSTMAVMGQGYGLE